MDLRDQLNAATPRLRRYARALVSGSPVPCDVADDLVHTTLMRAIGARQAAASSDLVIRLYATVTQLHRDLADVTRAALTAGATRTVPVSNAVARAAWGSPTDLSTGLLSLSVECREALLLVTLEGFDHADAARILRISRSVLMGRLTQARSGLDAFLRARPAATARPRNVPYLRLVT